MNVPPINGTSGAAGLSAPAQTVDYQAFLRLLVTQMKNQDPTAPMDSTDYVAQLATFSQVEQSVQINQKLDNILQASTFSQAGSLIGKYVTSPEGEVGGYVKQVRLYSDGIMAILHDGTELPIWAGVSITDKAPASNTPDPDPTPDPDTESEA